MKKKYKEISMIVLPAFLCYLLVVTGKLEGGFEYSQTYMLLYLCIRTVLEEKK